jgi:hypothetical protein
MMGTYSSVQERWSLLLAAWRESGLPAAEFCRRKQVSARRFYKWRKRLSPLPEIPARVGEAKAEGFVRVQFAARAASVDCGIAVALGDGMRLELSSGFDAEELSRAVRALRGIGSC